jgi:predicted alpha-1,2-mannosidase
MNTAAKILKPRLRRFTSALLAAVAAFHLMPQTAPAAEPPKDESSDFVSLVDPFIMSARGRWFFFGTGKRPFGMVNVFPDTRNDGQAGGGYHWPSKEVLGFSHLHGWMTAGPDVMPTTGGNYKLTKEGWKSPFQREAQIARPGYHKVHLDKYNLDAEVTSTDRVGFSRYTVVDGGRLDIIFSLGGPLGSVVLRNGTVTKVGDTEIEGYFDRTNGRWNGPPRIRTFFVAQVDRPFNELLKWSNDDFPVQPVSQGPRAYEGPFKDQSAVMVFDDLPKGAAVQLKVALSFTSIDNARNNLLAECPDWDFNRVADESRQAWNDVFGRIEVKGGTEKQRTKFYTDLWHALMGRHKLNDVNGAIPDYTDGKGNNTADLKIRQLPLGADGKPLFNYYNADSFWLTNFNLNLLWGIGWPDVLRDFANSFLEIDKWGGILPRGPNGGGYSYIMTGCPATPLIVSAHNLGLLKERSGADILKVIDRNHQPGSGMDKLYGDLGFYIKNGYCPMWDTEDKFDMSGGLTLEWAYNDWCAAQLAKNVGDQEKFDAYMKRSENFRNQWDSTTGFMRPRLRDGSWYQNFDPMRWYGFVEGNAWTYSFYVPQDVPALADLFGGPEAFSEKLEYALEQEKPHKFGRGHKGLFDYGNQPSCGMAHLFNLAGKPWLSQKWVREVSDIAFGGTDPHSGYCGEEDQGQMGALSALMKIGLFSVDGACGAEPRYEITSPLFDEVIIHLDPRYYPGGTFTIKAHNNSETNRYIQRATLNGKPHDSVHLAQKDLAAGGVLELWLGPEPNKEWGIEKSGEPPQTP